MAQGKDLKTSIQIDSSKAQRQIDKLIGKIKNITKAMDNVTNNEARLSSEIHNAVNETTKLKSATDGVANAARSVNRASKQHGVILGSLITKAKRLGATYLGVMGAKAIIRTADTITSAQNKLNNVNATQLGAEGVTTKNGKEVYSKATLNATNQQLEKIYNSANKVRTGYADMISNVSKSMILAGKSFQGNIDNALEIRETLYSANSSLNTKVFRTVVNNLALTAAKLKAISNDALTAKVSAILGVAGYAVYIELFSKSAKKKRSIKK